MGISLLLEQWRRSVVQTAQTVIDNFDVASANNAYGMIQKMKNS